MEGVLKLGVAARPAADARASVGMTGPRVSRLRRLCAFAIVVASLAGHPLAQQQVGIPSSQPAVPASNARLQDRVFLSPSLARTMKYRILLPDAYFQSTTRYPVLYLLHGWFGDYRNWSTLTSLARYAEALPVIIVMPDADNSWYTDSATVPQDKYEQYLIHDVIEEVDLHWRTLASPARRAIAGLSMGGYGAVKLALKYPGAFHFAASVSGAVNAASPKLADSRPDLQPSLSQAFGETHSKTREQNDLYLLATAANAQATPYLYLDCGTADSTFLEPNRKLASILSERKFAYEYHEYPGAHTWKYWDSRLPSVLSLVRRQIVEDIAH